MLTYDTRWLRKNLKHLLVELVFANPWDWEQITRAWQGFGVSSVGMKESKWKKSLETFGCNLANGRAPVRVMYFKWVGVLKLSKAESCESRRNLVGLGRVLSPTRCLEHERDVGVMKKIPTGLHGEREWSLVLAWRVEGSIFLGGRERSFSWNERKSLNGERWSQKSVVLRDDPISTWWRDELWE